MHVMTYTWHSRCAGTIRYEDDGHICFTTMHQHQQKSICITSEVTAVTEVRSASFGLELHVQHIFANSVNFLITWGLPVTVFHSTCIFCVYGMALYRPTLQFYVCVYVSFVCQYVVPLVSVITTLYYVGVIIHCRVWYRVLSLHYACIRSSG